MKGGYDGLINEGDIDFMRDSLDDIYTHRERPVTVKYFEIEYDPLTGVEIGKTESTREVSAVVTELSKGERANMREYESGVYIEQGDIKADIKIDRKSTRLNSSHVAISYAVFCLKKKKKKIRGITSNTHIDTTD